MKNKSVFITIFIIFMMALISGAAAENSSVRDLNEILSSGKVVVAMVDFKYPPFIKKNSSGGLEGLEVDMARDIADKLDVALEIVKTNYFDDIVDMVLTGKADIGLSNLSITYDRAKRIKFSDTYRTLGITLLLNRMKIASMKLSGGLKRVEQLQKTTDVIGVLKRSAYEAAARQYFPDANFKTYGEYEEMILASERGDVLLVIGNSGTIDTFLKEKPHLMVKLQPFKIKDIQDHIAMVVGLESDHLLSWLNAYLTVKGLSHR